MAVQNTESTNAATSAGNAATQSHARQAILDQVEVLRRNLLDIGTRNRLISAPLKSSRANVLEIIDERADHVFGSILRDNVAFTFIPNETKQPDLPENVEGDGAGDVDSVPTYVPPDDPSEGDSASRHKDSRLQTRLQAEPLQKRLLTLQRESVLIEEEQGANVLFLAIGFLKWFEADNSDVERFAPLILVPVRLDRDRVRSRFKLQRREDDIEVNLSLRAKLKQDFGIELSDLPDDDGWKATDYFTLVERSIASKARWTVDRDAMLLGFFSFSKFLLYRDLDPTVWPETESLDRHRIVSGLLGGGFDEPPLPIGDGDKLDDLLAPSDLGHVLDADSSQAAVIKMAADGRSMVVQGPPGTGKSQTIANVVAAAARDGKSILFIAEKMAALQVVYDRLRATGLDALCLELHSNKANKKAVLEELQRTLTLGRVLGATTDVAFAAGVVRDQLNVLSRLLHQPLPSISETPFQTIAALVGLRERGITPPDFSLNTSQLADLEGNRRALEALEVLADLSAKGGPSRHHPWRGVKSRLTPIELERLRPQIRHLIDVGKACRAAAAAGAALLGPNFPVLEGLGEADVQWLAHFKSLPEERELLKRRELRANTAAALTTLQLADDASRLRTQALAHTTEVGLTQNVTATRQAIASRGKSFFRFLSGEYRRAVALLDSVSTADRAKTYEDRIRRLDDIIAFQLADRRLSDEEARGSELFGRLWEGLGTATKPLREAVEWYMAGQQLPQATALLDGIVETARDRVDIAEAERNLKQHLQEFTNAWNTLLSVLALDVGAAFDDAGEAPDIAAIVARAEIWTTELDRIDEWFRLTASEEECRRLELGQLVDRLALGLLKPELALEVYKYARAESLWKRMIEHTPALATLRGDERTALVAKFRTLEKELFAATAREIADKHAMAIPTGAQGQMGYIRGQIALRRGHASIRRLMDNAGEAIQKIKPVFLMSPISVAQFLPPGRLKFDLILMDEASQVRPEDAMGAIARGGRLVVVGDSKQLPPTSFFDRTVSAAATGATDDDAPMVSAGAMESILTLCEARGLPGRTLQWHYRSRHPSLIQVSNQAFYDHKLKFPPSPELAGRDGLIFRRVRGSYDRGKTRTNAIEAKAVADAVMAHARETPHLSLGVATLSVTQRDAILAELELLRAKHQELESFFSRTKEEPFFVKNLENVQGDERDVIYVSICYARDADGYLSQGFGPVSSEGGERRLNVLFTRAKRRCEIFSSIGHADIEVRGETVPFGRRVLQTYLKFAETGQTDTPLPTGQDADSDFEIAVGNRIRAAGYEVDFQVGSAGFRVDIGVRDPSYSNAYVLGVECDGATYHSAAWARERDRLRQQVLETKGWRLHRIWSTDWFARPDNEMKKLLGAIDAAKAARKSEVEAEQEARDHIRMEREAAQVTDNISVPYQEANLPRIGNHPELHSVPAALLADYLADVVRIEQPIHTDELAKRVARAWGAQRTGARIKASVERALAAAKASGKLKGEEFWTLPEAVIKVRSRSAVSSTSLRQLEYVPPQEIDAALLDAVSRNIAITVEEAARAVSEALGFSATSSQLKSLVDGRAQQLASSGSIGLVDGVLKQLDSNQA